jgi:hypothetical protein
VVPTPTPTPLPVDVDGPTLLSVTISPTTTDLDGGQISVWIDAQDASGINTTQVSWVNPAGYRASIFCDVFVNTSCTNTKTMGQHQFTLAGDYIWATVRLTDTNGKTRYYNPNGIWEEPGITDIYGSHGFSVPDLVLNSAPSDTTPPVVTGVSVHPAEEGNASYGDNIDIKVSASDTQSAVGSATVIYRKPDGFLFHWNCYIGQLSGSCTMAANIEVGVHPLELTGAMEFVSVIVEDESDNSYTYGPDELSFSVPDIFVHEDGSIGFIY